MSDYMRDLRERVGTSLLVMPSATALVVEGEGANERVLLVRHSNGGVWAPPGGAIDPDEAPQDAVVREVWEETGLLVEPVALCGVFGGPQYRVTYGNGDVTGYVTSVFECRVTGGEVRVDGEEVLEARFVSREEFASLPIASWAEYLVPQLLARAPRAWIPPVTWQPPKN